MGWTVLYIAFGVVALWLLGEVLLQYKARLRWRLLAFAGFLGVVAGVAIPSVAVIIVGAIAFGVGQTFVTLSFRRGFSRGWAIRRKDEEGASESAPKAAKDTAKGRGAGGGKSRAGRRRKTAGGAPAPAPVSDMTLPASGPDALAPLPDVDAGGPGQMPGMPQQPDSEPATPGSYEQTAAFPAVSGTGPEADGFAAYDTYGQQHTQAPAQGGYAEQFDYGQGQYASYSDPYIGNRPQSYEQYDAYGQQQPYPQQQYGVGAYSAETYSPQYDMDTPPGGVWVPQQREGDVPPAPPGQQQPYPPQQLPGQGFDEQRYRY
ncbi:hypothetical protein FHS39_001859 [Streptomyces olivoverticillatus]|uniref:Uncharacterized protein n=1 Tax=Streptomyces olivoverticillatus TaxID=66427 RepID=A0A7W7PKX0_9ACTN|nr:hypothetical protein [Streptomyces olivoverticillatus]MBB4892848.1 hypothetical protein [Streptomyces olivoverticillatus]